MQLPDRPIRIMGIPWKVEVVDVIDGDPANASDIRQGACVMQLSSETPQARWAWNIFWCITAAVQTLVCDARYRQKDGDIGTIHQALWTAIRDNWALVRKWFGVDGKNPEVPDGTRLRIGGFDCILTRPHRLAGATMSTFGVFSSGDLLLQVRQGLSPEYASQTALHELMHAALHSLDPLWNDESFIGPMSAGLAQVFFDNPEWTEALFGYTDQPKE